MNRLPDANLINRLLSPGSRVLITGANGFIGKHLSLLLREYTGITERWDLSVGNDLVHSVDLLDEDRTHQELDRLKPDIVFHLASSGVSHQNSHDHRVIGIDLQMTANIISALNDLELKHIPVLVIAGSMAEYAPLDRPLAETDQCYPITAYGIAKHAVTLYALAYCHQKNISLRLPRLFHIYGPGEAPGRLFPTLLEGLAKQESTALSSGDQRRDFIHVADVCEAMVRLAGCDEASGRIVNVGTGETCSVRDVAHWVAGQLDVDPDLLKFGHREPSPGDHNLLVADTTRLEGLLQWVPPQRLLSSHTLTELFDIPTGG